MTKRPSTGWTIAARAMAAQGASIEEIARACKIEPSAVRLAVDPEFRAARYARKLAAIKQREAERPARPLKLKLDRAAVMPAAREFAAGRIDRAELMRRITLEVGQCR